jgi:Beta/Gamma crystallin
MFQWKSGVLRAAAATLCAAAAAVTWGAAGTPAAQPQDRRDRQDRQDRLAGGIGITVYSDANYRGDNATFRNDEPDLRQARFEGRISSFRIADGEVWEVCEGVNYRPPCQVFSGTESNLQNRRWNDRIMSLRRVRGGNGRGDGGFPFPGGGGRGGGGSLVLYSDKRFRGQERRVVGPTSSLGSYNDRAESVRVNGGVWELCEDNDYGKCRTVDRDLPDLGSIGLNKRLSSARPLYGGGRRGRGGDDGYPGGGYPGGGPQRARLVLYDGDRYRGAARTLDDAEGRLGGFSRAQSAQVTGSWQLCDGPNFTGRCVTLSEDVPNLDRYGLTRIGSAQPLGGRR